MIGFHITPLICYCTSANTHQCCFSLYNYLIKLLNKLQATESNTITLEFRLASPNGPMHTVFFLHQVNTEDKQ